MAISRAISYQPATDLPPALTLQTAQKQTGMKLSLEK
jgi:hypothetical protein